MRSMAMMETLPTLYARLARGALLVLAVLALLAPCTGAQPRGLSFPEMPAVGEAPVEYEARVIEGSPQQHVRLQGDARVIHGEHAIRADIIDLDHPNALAHATGEVRLWYRGDVAYCQSLRYDLNSKEARLYNARMIQGVYYLHGEEIIIDASRVIQIRHGDLTTCDLPHPHYTVGCRDLIIVPDRKLQAYHTTYNIMDVPVLYLPYLRRSLREQPYTTNIAFGHSDNLGLSMHNRARYKFDDYFHPSLFLDLYSKAGVAVGAGNDYAGRGGHENMYGRADFWWIDQNNPDDDNFFSEQERYRAAGYHFSRLPFAGAELTANYYKLSDNDVINDYEDTFRLQKWSKAVLEDERNSFAQLRLPHDDYNVRLLYEDRINDFFLSPLPVEEKSPQLHAELRRRRLAERGPFLRASFDYANARLESGDPVGPAENLRAVDKFNRVDADVELSHPWHLLPWLNVAPYLNYRLTDYHDPETKRWLTDRLAGAQYDDVTRHAAGAGVGLHSRVAQPLGPAAGVGAQRLVFEPFAALEGVAVEESLFDQQPFRVTDPDGVYSFPVIDDLDEPRGDMGRLRYRFDSAWQTKSDGGSVNTPARLAISGAWRFHRQDGPELEDTLTEGWVEPYSWLRYFVHHRYDHEYGETRSYDTGVTTRYTPWNLAVTTSYVGSRIEEDGPIGENIYADLHVAIGPKYHFGIENRYDLDDEVWRETRAILSRDLHDWWLDFLLRYRDRDQRDNELSVGLVLRLKLPGEITRGMPSRLEF